MPITASQFELKAGNDTEKGNCVEQELVITEGCPGAALPPAFVGWLFVINHVGNYPSDLSAL